MVIRNCILRTGRKLWISVYITFEKDLVSLAKFKAIQSECIAALAEEYPDFYFELLPDIAFTGAEKAALEQKILKEQMQEMQEGSVNNCTLPIATGNVKIPIGIVFIVSKDIKNIKNIKQGARGLYKIKLSPLLYTFQL